jgi:hypothetical protein
MLVPLSTGDLVGSRGWGINFGTGGVSVEIAPASRNQTQNAVTRTQFANFENEGWISPATRIIAISFNVYNHQVNAGIAKFENEALSFILLRPPLFRSFKLLRSLPVLVLCTIKFEFFQFLPLKLVSTPIAESHLFNI